MLQAFIDDSYTENGVFVLGGYIASAEAWAAFSTEWEALLPIFGRRRRDGKFHFKMSQMADRLQYVRPFHGVIEQHVIASIAYQMRLDDLRRARDRILVEGTNIIWDMNPFKFAFRTMLKHFHLVRVSNITQSVGDNRALIDKLIPADQAIDFYFDEESSSKEIIEVWTHFVETRPENIKFLYGATPRFEKDELFLPLQAADFWAWWVRKGIEDERLEAIIRGDFGAWRANKHIVAMVIRSSEDQIVEEAITSLRAAYGETLPVRDKKKP